MGKTVVNDTKAKSMIKVSNIIFLLFVFLIIFGFIIAIAIRGELDKSLIENRGLAKFPKFNVETFLNGKFQDKVEDSLADQMYMGEYIKDKMTQTKAEVTLKVQKKIVISLYDKNQTQLTDTGSKRNIKYIPVSKDVCYYGNSNYMLYKPISLNENKDKIDELAKVYNKHFKE